MRPPHRPVALPGLHAYTDQISLEAGQEIALHVSSDTPYSLSFCRLGPDLNSPADDEVLAREVCLDPKPQPIYPGSYVHIDKGLAQGPLPALTFECWVKIWGLPDWQCMVSQAEHLPEKPQGFGLFVSPDGHLVLRHGTGLWAQSADGAEVLRSPTSLTLGEWVHLAAVLEPDRTELWLNGRCTASAAQDNAVSLDLAPLRLGACGISGVADMFLEGDMVMPSLYAAALGPEAIAERVAARGTITATHPQLLACWPMDELHGTRVRDHSPHARHGTLVNHGTRAINGPALDPTTIPRYRDDATLHLKGKAPPERAGLRFASDDLVDCGWAPQHVFKVPAEARSGLYVARFNYVLRGEIARYDVTFVVKRNPTQPRPKLLVLCATNTWLAYAASPFAAGYAQPAVWPRRCTGLPNSHPRAPKHSTYSFHRGGQPTYYVGTRMPRPHTAPYELYDPKGSGFAQWTRLERVLHTWLDAHGYDYDLIADIDLHRSPEMLSAYEAVVVNGHSEYWSEPAKNGLDRYLDQGGNAIVLSGNSMYWRVSFDEEGCVMEQRKTRTPHDIPDAGDQSVAAPAGPHGEQYHSQDGRRGGLWRYAGTPATAVIGLETAGWGFADPEDFGVYRVRNANHPLFTQPFATGLADGDTFGHGPNGALPRAIGHEWDLTASTLLRMTPHVPADADEPECQQGIEVIAEGIRNRPGRLDAYLDFFEAPTASLDGLSCEMILWQRPGGGSVFNAGAVGSSWVLGVDEKMGKLLANVLDAFSVPYPPMGPYRHLNNLALMAEKTA